MDSPFEAIDHGSRLTTPGLEWKPSEHFVRVHHRLGGYVVYKAYGYTGWNGRGWPRKYYPTEYTLARMDRLPECRFLVTPLKTITPGREKAPLRELVGQCDGLGSGLLLEKEV
jgi:hypothetical protein